MELPDVRVEQTRSTNSIDTRVTRNEVAPLAEPAHDYHNVVKAIGDWKQMHLRPGPTPHRVFAPRPPAAPVPTPVFAPPRPAVGPTPVAQPILPKGHGDPMDV